MCISNGPATLAKTRILVHDTVRPDGTPVRVLAYQNSAENHDGRGPNAMIFFVPSAAPLTARNFIPEALEYRGALKQMEESLLPQTRGMYSFLGAATREATKFDYGQYEVVAGRPVDAFDLVETVTPAKRPELKPWVRDFFAMVDPSLSVVIACFDSRKMFEADPIFIAYIPIDEANYHIPMFDGHDGQMPRIERDVQRDHFLIFGSTSGRELVHQSETDILQLASPWFLPPRAVGVKLAGDSPNSDMVTSKQVIDSCRPSDYEAIFRALSVSSPLRV